MALTNGALGLCLDLRGRSIGHGWRKMAAKPQITWERAPGRKWVVTVCRPEERVSIEGPYYLWPPFGILAPQLGPLSGLFASFGLYDARQSA